MTDNQQNPNPNQQPNNRPFRGSEGVIKNLSTSPDSNNDRESLLDQIVDTPQESQPAQDKETGKNDTK